MLIRITATLLILLTAGRLRAETLGEYWGTAEEESKYYEIVEIPIPAGMAIEAGSFEVMPDDRLAIGTRRGDIFLASGAFDKNPLPTYKRFASGLDEVMGMSYKDGSFYVTQQTEVTRITDTDDDERADRFETLSDVWGFRNYHEFAFGSKLDPDGNIWVALCLSKSYHSDAPFRGWCLKVTPDGKDDSDLQWDSQPLWNRTQRTWRDVLCRKPGAVERIMFVESAPAGRIHGAPDQLQLVRSGAEHGRKTDRAEHAITAADRTKTCQAAGALRRRVSLHQDGAFDFRIHGRSHGWKVWAVREPDLHRRFQPECRDACDHRTGERCLARRLLSVSRRLGDRAAGCSVHAAG